MQDELRKKLNKDTDTLKKLEGISSVSEIVSILNAAGYSVAEADITAGGGATGQLNDSELAQVAGGGLFSLIGNTCGSSMDTTDGRTKCNPGDCG